MTDDAPMGHGPIDDALPRQYVRTRRFTAGRPRDIAVAPDGERLLFLRSASGTDPVQALWTLRVEDGAELLVADPAGLSCTATAGDIPAAERARRERRRELGAGITAYATDAGMRKVAFALSGRLWLASLDEASPDGASRDEASPDEASPDEAAARELPTGGGVVDPRPDPTGRRIGYVASGALRVIDADGKDDRVVAVPEGDQVSYGLAEFVAAEEMGRSRGYWWSPDGDRLLVARVDTSMVGAWYVFDPADPAASPTTLRYPVAGSANADVTLWVLGLDGSRVEVGWDRGAYEYVVAVHWDRHGLLVVVQNRAQSSMRILGVDPDTGATEVVREDRDPAWVPTVSGVPARTASGALVWAVETADTRHLLVGGAPVTPAGLQLREVLDVDGDTVLFTASTEPTETHLYTWSADAGLGQLTTEPGVCSGRLAGGTLAVSADTMAGVQVIVHRDGRSPVPIASHVEPPVLTPRVEWLRAGETEIRTAVVFPTGHVAGMSRLPVLLDPYGGPAAQRVTTQRAQYLVSQWFADQGFAVVIADGRGTPGRGPAWDRTIRHNKADPALEDQIAALRAAAERYPDLDLDRVAIRGWSYGGFLAALAVLRRPDVFHAAVAGAPVTDQRLYDTYYQEKYLGHPDKFPEVYEHSSLISDAPRLSRPLMLIHGLADDNVVPAHTLRLSAALLAAGRPHTVLPMSGVTHLAATDAAANLLVLQVRFLREALEARTVTIR